MIVLGISHISNPSASIFIDCEMAAFVLLYPNKNNLYM